MAAPRPPSSSARGAGRSGGRTAGREGADERGAAAPSSTPARGTRAAATTRPPERHSVGKRAACSPLRRGIDGVVATGVAVVATYFGACLMLLAVYGVVYPPTTGVMVQRRLEAWASGADYDRHYEPVSTENVSVNLRHAVVAAEDGRFYAHGGLDLDAMREARRQAERTGRPMRGASTLTQQLVKNLFATTRRSVVRKGVEVPLTLAAEAILPKDRILDLYTNVVEFGPGVYGAEAAAESHFGTSARRLTRTQSATLAALLPNPHTRTPANVGWYRRLILRRMRAMGW